MSNSDPTNAMTSDDVGHTRVGRPQTISYADLMKPDEDWRNLPEASERRKIQNRLAQRAYRRNMRVRTEEVEKLKKELTELQSHFGDALAPDAVQGQDDPAPEKLPVAGDGYVDSLHIHHPGMPMTNMPVTDWSMPASMDLNGQVMSDPRAMVAHWNNAFPVPQQQMPGASAFYSVHPHAGVMQHAQMSRSEPGTLTAEAYASRQSSQSPVVKADRLSGPPVAGDRPRRNSRRPARSSGPSPMPTLIQSTEQPAMSSESIPTPSLEGSAFPMHTFINPTKRASNSVNICSTDAPARKRARVSYGEGITTSTGEGARPNDQDVPGENVVHQRQTIIQRRMSTQSSISRAPSVRNDSPHPFSPPPIPATLSPATTISTASSLEPSVAPPPKVGHSSTPSCSSRLSLSVESAAAEVPPATVGTSSLLHLAVAGDHKETLSLLLQHAKISLELKDEAGFTVLQRAVMAGKTEMVKVLLEAGADVGSLQ